MRHTLVLASIASLTLAPSAQAAQPAADASVSVDPAPAQDSAQTPWIKRHAPERGMVELGLFGGVLLPSTKHELYKVDQSRADLGFREYKTVSADLGARLGYYPLKYFGIEGEFAVMPAETTDGGAATLWSPRGHVVAQLGMWSVTPFVLVGGGAMGSSGSAGRDVDGSLHFGGGLKFFVHDLLNIRLDVRDNVGSRRGNDGAAHHVEVLLGLSVTLGRKKAPPAPVDSDHDGFFDPQDSCPAEPGVAPDGCPIRDRDGDSFLDAQDSCPDEPGVAPDGCPIRDSDGDGFLDPEDTCPEEAGVAPDGCPIRDSDGDGIFDDMDKCIDEPETDNGYQDDDGCPDEIPKKLKEFTGVIEGIYFDVNKASIRKKSEPTLKKASDVLAEFKDIRVEISGHTDSSGKRERNMKLSAERAESVKAWMVDKGIDGSRIDTRGAGPDEPVDSNKTKAGRSKNRRIEFRLVVKKTKVSASALSNAAAQAKPDAEDAKAEDAKAEDAKAEDAKAEEPKAKEPKAKK